MAADPGGGGGRAAGEGRGRAHGCALSRGVRYQLSNWVAILARWGDAWGTRCRPRERALFQAGDRMRSGGGSRLQRDEAFLVEDTAAHHAQPRQRAAPRHAPRGPLARALLELDAPAWWQKVEQKLISGAACGELLGPRRALKLVGRRSWARRRAPSHQGGRWGAVLGTVNQLARRAPATRAP